MLSPLRLNLHDHRFSKLVTFVVLLCLVAFTSYTSGVFAQQNGTDCQSYFISGEGTVMTLHIDSVCDSDGNVRDDPYSWGSNHHAACYSDGNGLSSNTTCDACPPSNPNCTPDSPPLPPGGGFRITDKVLNFLDWLTA